MGEKIMVLISKYLDDKKIKFLNVRTRDEAIEALLEGADSECILDKETFHQAILDREKLVSTGIGMGVAIPHAKLPFYDDFFILVGILDRGLDWEALDGTPVRIIFLVGGPDDKQTQYLQILSLLTLAVKDEERRKNLLKALSPKDVIDLFKEL